MLFSLPPLTAVFVLRSAEDSRVGGDSSGSAGVRLLPASAQRRNRDEGKRTHEDVLAAGREQHQLTEERMEQWRKRQFGYLNEGRNVSDGHSAYHPILQ